MTTPRARDTDLQALTPRVIGLLPTLLCLIAELMLHRFHQISDLAFWCSLLILDPIVWAVSGWGAWRLMGVAAEAFASMTGATMSTDYAPEYSAIDALIARGDFTTAVTSYRARIDTHPDDLVARLRLAVLFESLQQFDRAESCYLAVRARATTSDQRTAVANGLVDLYRKTGDDDKLRAELSGFGARGLSR